MLNKPETLPLLALKDVVLFPGIISPVFIGRKKSLNAIVATKKMGDGKHILLTAQQNQQSDDPKASELYNVGIYAQVLQTIKLPNDNAKIVVEALSRVELSNIKGRDYLNAEYRFLPDKEVRDLENLNLVTAKAVDSFKEYARANKKIHFDLITILGIQKNPSYITNLIAFHLTSPIEVKQILLQEPDSLTRAQQIIDIITKENAQDTAFQNVQDRVRKQIEQNQRTMFLNEQMKAIKDELEGDGGKSEFQDLESKIKKLKLSKEATEKAESEMRKLKMMNQMSSEYSVVRNYLETLLGMPWGKESKSNIDINKAEEVLNRDHYGLEKVKERIIEYLAVLKRSKKIKGPILCLIGPPGVGKTSLVKSIAEALGRKYVKFALGGVRDEAEVRGHRRTYLGSMPGKIVSSLKKVKVDNPVMLLDELDKMSSDQRGDPSSAMLEALDPEQNSHFVDHYLEVEYNLSNTVFIATANYFNDIPIALIDRLEIIHIAGYTESEKLQIAKNYMIKKQMKDHGLRKGELEITDEAIIDIIRYYTREAGVRELERKIGSLARKVLTNILKDKDIKNVLVKADDLEAHLGVRKYRFGLVRDKDQVGVTTGLAYTQVGGDILNIEAVAFKGKGGIKSTGKLGEVMKESAQAAYSCALSNAKKLGIKDKDYQEKDIHIHVPEGATPKDGPSAGIAIYTTIVSLLTNKPVKKDVAMTGEITLHGNVLPIGGLKEKLLAASRGGIKTVLIPEDNIKDLAEIPDDIKGGLDIKPVDDVTLVTKYALAK